MGPDKLLELLDTYKGRDRFLRLLGYASKCAAGLTSDKISPQLDRLSYQLSTTRTALRLLDGIPAVANAVQYGLGKKEEDNFIRFLNVVSNIVDVLFCPIDHISWAIEHRIILSKSSKWDTLNTSLWVASLYLYIMTNLRKINKIMDEKERLAQTGNYNSKEMKTLSETQSRLLLSTVKSTLDIIFAVHYLPPGLLWSGRLSKWQVGALGTISSVIAIYQCFK